VIITEYITYQERDAVQRNLNKNLRAMKIFVILISVIYCKSHGII
jgi:hypothetical protein